MERQISFTYKWTIVFAKVECNLKTQFLWQEHQFVFFSSCKSLAISSCRYKFKPFTCCQLVNSVTASIVQRFSDKTHKNISRIKHVAAPNTSKHLKGHWNSVQILATNIKHTKQTTHDLYPNHRSTFFFIYRYYCYCYCYFPTLSSSLCHIVQSLLSWVALMMLKQFRATSVTLCD